MKPVKKVIIEIRSGFAIVMEKSQGIELIIKDYDIIHKDKKYETYIYKSHHDILRNLYLES